MSKAIGYVRMPPETFSDGDGIERQRARIVRWAANAGLPLRNVHVESNHTAPDGIGEGLQAALAELKKGDVLVIDRLALAATNLPDWMAVVERIQHTGADLAAVGDGFDTRPEQPGGDQVAGLLKGLSALPKERPQAPSQTASHASTASNANANGAGTPAPNDYLVIYTQARALLAEGKTKKAITLWRRFLKTAAGENAACGWNCVGDILVAKDQPAKAVQYFLQAARDFEGAGYPDRALAMYNKAQRHAPLQADVTLRKARLFTQLGRMGDAVNCYLDYARGQAENGDIGTALRVFDRIRVLDPMNARFRLQVAAELWEFGFITESVAEELNAAELMVQQGHPEEARKQLLRVMEANPENTAVAAFIDRIDRGRYDEDLAFEALGSLPDRVAGGDADDLQVVELHHVPEQVWVRG